MKRLLLPLLLAACNSGGSSTSAAAGPASTGGPASATAPKPASDQPGDPAAKPAAPSAGAAQVVAVVGSESITMADLDQAAGRELFEIRERTLEELVTRKVVEAAAKQANLPTEEFFRVNLEKRVPRISDEEAQRFFAENQARMGPDFAGKAFAEVKDQLVQGLTDQKRRDAAQSFLSELRQQAGAKILLESPRVEVAATGPARGPENAPVTIVEFSDFECPFCSRGREVAEQVMKAYEGKVRLVFRDFPLNFHQNAQKAAEAGRCAHEQGKFWEMHDWMFAHQQELQPAQLGGGATSIGLDRAKFDECLASGRHAQGVQADLAAGQQVGVSGTPAFFVNGRMINGAQPFEKFKELIDRELGKSGTAAN